MTYRPMSHAVPFYRMNRREEDRFDDLYTPKKPSPFGASRSFKDPLPSGYGDDAPDPEVELEIEVGGASYEKLRDGFDVLREDE